MTKQTRAIYLAEIIEASYCHDAYDAVFFHAATELRRLHIMNAELLTLFKEFQAASKAENYGFDGKSWIERMDAALAKATGETK
jgi:hypothetical protein